MHGTGLTVSESTRSEFARLSADSNTLFVKFNIDNGSETFVLKGSDRFSDSRESDFLKMQKALDNTPAFLVARTRSGAEDKWTLIFYMPDGSSVKDRMVYAASTAALRQGLGQGMFTPNVYSITSKNELTMRDYDGSLTQSSASLQSLMTREERLKEDSEVAAAMSMGSVKVSAIVGLPVKADEKAVQALQALAQKSGYNTGVFLMHSEAEILMVEKFGNFSLDEVDKLVPPSEPRYIIHSFNHQNNEGEDAHAHIFIYYCPDRIKPKLKMFYSTCKSMVVKMCENFGCTNVKSIEVSDPREVSVKNTLEDLYPKADEKKMFKKPAKTGKGGNKFLGGGFKA